eukprot:scaffold32412_cov59-Attheya_sp.AAC.1
MLLSVCPWGLPGNIPGNWMHETDELVPVCPKGLVEADAEADAEAEAGGHHTPHRDTSVGIMQPAVSSSGGKGANISGNSAILYSSGARSRIAGSNVMGGRYSDGDSSRETTSSPFFFRIMTSTAKSVRTHL